jgi:glutathione synthase
MGKVVALCKHIKIHDNKKKFYSKIKTISLNLEKSRVILIRNDPPFDNRYLYTTFLLNHISKKVKIVNHPSAVRNVSVALI